MLKLHPSLSLKTLESHMVQVEGGTFEMGGESGLLSAKPIHTVRLDNFEICRYPVNQQLWYEVMGGNPVELRFENRNRPVERISWGDINGQFLPALRKKSGDDSYCLPTEAQWEFAARGGKFQEREKAYTYPGSNYLKEVGWYNKNSFSETNLLGCKRPNALGLFGMSGNVWEWCQDWYASEYYKECEKKGIVQNPGGPETGSSRVVRGGSWGSADYSCRVSVRDLIDPLIRVILFGFRLCRYSPR